VPPLLIPLNSWHRRRKEGPFTPGAKERKGGSLSIPYRRGEIYQSLLKMVGKKKTSKSSIRVPCEENTGSVPRSRGRKKSASFFRGGKRTTDLRRGKGGWTTLTLTDGQGLFC